ncbi:hypothetical protein DH09_08280 [Bacillaceae bacterium JMAK1]|nr:hypothetical protein DH09_08280 [Bacillaceae bacterium JMAK1]
MVTSAISYKDLCQEIDILDIRISSLKREREQYRRMMFANAPKGISAIDYAAVRVQTSFSPLPLDEVLFRIDKIDQLLDQLRAIMKDKRFAKEEMENHICKFEGLEYKVYYMRVQGYSLQEIASELGYSYSWIKKISHQIKKGTFKEPTA